MILYNDGEYMVEFRDLTGTTYDVFVWSDKGWLPWRSFEGPLTPTSRHARMVAATWIRSLYAGIAESAINYSFQEV